MSDYTYKDFKRAQFAIDPSKDYPAQRHWGRWCSGDFPWSSESEGWRFDDEMAVAGCIPVYAEPYSPSALQRAWEHGEEPKPGARATEGMVTVFNMEGLALSLRVSEGDEYLGSQHRIVYRPPVQERDPVDDLAQAMEDALPEEAGSPVALRRYAEALAEHGVRVVADDE